MNYKKSVYNILFIPSLLLIGVVISESTGRLLGLGKPLLYRKDPLVGYRLQPNQNNRRRNNSMITTDYEGFRVNSKVQKVGVFVNTDNNEINTISKDIGLDYVQLHGNEGVEDIFEIKLPCIKALDGNSRSLSDNINMFKNAKYLLLDNISKNIKGGSGNKFDWNNLKNIDNKKNIILSGGLSQENILDAIDKTDIEFYDFCSSTEIKPGIKNIKKIESIVNLINNAKK